MKKGVGFIGCILVIGFALICRLLTDTEAETIKNTKLTIDARSMMVGDSYKIKFKDVPEGTGISFKSSDKKVAKVALKGKKVKGGMVTQFGRINALGAGQATITVTMELDGEQIVECIDVTVSEPENSEATFE